MIEAYKWRVLVELAAVVAVDVASAVVIAFVAEVVESVAFAVDTFVDLRKMPCFVHWETIGMASL